MHLLYMCVRHIVLYIPLSHRSTHIDRVLD